MKRLDTRPATLVSDIFTIFAAAIEIIVSKVQKNVHVFCITTQVIVCQTQQEYVLFYKMVVFQWNYECHTGFNLGSKENVCLSVRCNTRKNAKATKVLK